MYMFPPPWERKKNNIFTAWNLCVSTRNKHLYNIYMNFLKIFFFSIQSFYPVVKSVGLYRKAFIATTNIHFCGWKEKEKHKI